jgi:hypothetical protein
MDYNGAIILSGEGIRGVFQRHTGKPTLRAINRRLTKECCGGDRWAKAFVPAGPECKENTYLEIDRHGGFVDWLTIADIDIDD